MINLDPITCKVCKGEGWYIREHDIECVYCGGEGVVFSNKLQRNLDCHYCHGRGYVHGFNHYKCIFCKGSGKRYWLDNIIRPISEERN